MKVAVVLLFLSMPAYTQQQFDVCKILTSEWNQRERRGTSNSLLTEFRTPVTDEKTRKSFKHLESALTVNVGIEYLRFDEVRKGKPSEIRIAISVSDREEDAFEVVQNAIAGTFYSAKWGGLYVQKQIVVGEVEHTFILDCSEETRKKKGF